MDGHRVPAVLGAQALHEGIGTMRAMAINEKSCEPALRVRGLAEEIWIGLGGKEWELVRLNRPLND